VGEQETFEGAREGVHILTIQHKRYAILIEILPDDRGSADGMTRLRKFLKAALRSWGIRCIAIRPPEETKTFGTKEQEE
jgi:hypothetical protein